MSSPKKWEWVILDKLGKLECGSPWNKKYSSILLDKKIIPFIDGTTIGKAKLYIKKTNKFYDSCFVDPKIKIFSKNTLCFIKDGSVGKGSALLKFNSYLSHHIYAFSSYINISNIFFIKYCLDFRKIKDKMISLSKSQTAQPGLNLHKLLTIKFPCPSQEEQERIGNTLSAYDELIENNERQIEVLQGIRTSIFKEWFVNFRFPNYLTYEAERERERGVYLILDNINNFKKLLKLLMVKNMQKWHPPMENILSSLPQLKK
ncbi:restriction endonuclease subunit S [Mycoplasma suis]|uniref:restriction endonuclease subunit S n=1 Tax=Mycoplasma suis TaxID=57372 RepID=UPI0003143DFD|nr:restriction endonuclease subunit S [Mycoplasma suis]